jgi:hypothetical protein
MTNHLNRLPIELKPIHLHSYFSSPSSVSGDMRRTEEVLLISTRLKCELGGANHSHLGLTISLTHHGGDYPDGRGGSLILSTQTELLGRVDQQTELALERVSEHISPIWLKKG